MTERDVLTVARTLALLVEDANATLARMVEAGWVTRKGEAVVIAWQERAERALEDAGRLL